MGPAPVPQPETSFFGSIIQNTRTVEPVVVSQSDPAVATQVVETTNTIYQTDPNAVTQQELEERLRLFKLTLPVTITPTGYATPSYASYSYTNPPPNMASIEYVNRRISEDVSALALRVDDIQAIQGAQWTSSGSNLSYVGGNVGIGTSTPAVNLEVAGGSYLGANYPILRMTGDAAALQFFSPNSTAAVNRKHMAIVYGQFFDFAGATTTAFTFQRRNDTGGFNANLMSLSNEGRLALDASSATPQGETKLMVANDSLTLPQVTLRSLRAGVAINDIVGGINFNSNDSNLAAPGTTTASILALANTAHTASQLGTDLAFSVTDGITMSEAMRILGNGNVGVGTTTPSSRFAVTGSGSTTGILARFADSNNVPRFTLRDNGEGAISKLGVGQTVANGHAFNVSGVAAFSLGANDYFGIGTGSNGFGALRVNNSGQTIMGAAHGGVVPTARLTVVGSSTDATNAFNVMNSTQTNLFNVLNTGNVGIGTVAPGSKLTVVGTPANGQIDIAEFAHPSLGWGNIVNIKLGTLSGSSVSGGYAAIQAGRFAEGDRGLRLIGKGQNEAVAPTSIHLDGNGGAISFNTNTQNATGTERMRIDANGNLGIGTATPVGKLDIALSPGNAYARFASSVGGVASGGLELGGFFSELASNRYGLFVSNSGSLTVSNQGNSVLSISAAGIVATPSIRISSNQGLPADPTYSFSGDTDTGMYRVGANVLGFSTDGSERLRVDSSGSVGIGTTTPSQRLSVAGSVQSTALLGGSANLTVDANGVIIRDPSDASLKQNIATIENALDKVSRLRGVSYEWIDKARFGTSSEIGVIAQEVEQVVPEVVSSGGAYKSVKIANLVGLLIEAVKELKAGFDSLAQSVRTKFVGTDKIETKELCFEELCVTKEQFRAILNNANIPANVPATPAPALVPTPVVEAVQDDSADLESPDADPAAGTDEGAVTDEEVKGDDAVNEDLEASSDQPVPDNEPEVPASVSEPVTE